MCKLATQGLCEAFATCNCSGLCPVILGFYQVSCKQVVLQVAAWEDLKIRSPI